MDGKVRQKLEAKFQLQLKNLRPIVFREAADFIADTSVKLTE